MLPPPFDRALVLTGPTASGKTQLGIELAQRLGAEIVAMDSMTLYRGMDIGTAKPTAVERAAVRHHLLDVLDAWDSASVAWWLKQAAECCRDIEERGKRILFVGGTPLYLKALLCGLFDGPPADAGLRRRLEAEAAAIGTPRLHERLAQVDAVSGQRIHANDLRRIVRALEVYELTGRPMSAWQTQWQRTPGDQKDANDDTPRALNVNGDPPPVICLDVPRTELYARINARVEAMFAAGVVDEVRRLRALPRPWSREAAKALGYREVCAYLDGISNWTDTITQVQLHSRQFAKRQLTWFRHLPYCRAATKELTENLWCRTING
jgi:tRNA dimethylallyltransferase